MDEELYKVVVDHVQLTGLAMHASAIRIGIAFELEHRRAIGRPFSQPVMSRLAEQEALLDEIKAVMVVAVERGALEWFTTPSVTLLPPRVVRRRFPRARYIPYDSDIRDED